MFFLTARTPYWMCRAASVGSLAFGLLSVFSSSLARSDWPGLLGPNRNGIADANAKLPDAIKSTPRIVWQVPAGQGYAGPAIAGNDVVLFERVGEKDRVRMVDLDTGKESWRRDLEAKYRGGVNPDSGPRCVPSILDKSVLVYSAAGDLTLLDRKSGTVQWTRSMRTKYEAGDGYFGAGSTPLVVGDRAIVNVGGKKASVVCVSLKNGDAVWTAAEGEASYASPVLFSSQSDRQSMPIAVVPTRLATLGLDIESGKELWRVPFGQRGPTVNAATPIAIAGGKLFLTASYGIGSLTLRPSSTAAEIVRKGNDISSQYATPIAMDGMIFGCDGREDGGPGTYKCIREQDETLVWEQEDMPICHTLGIGKNVLVCGIDGRLWNLKSSAVKFAPSWATSLPAGVYRAIPAFSGERLLTRSTGSSGDSWYCVEFK